MSAEDALAELEDLVRCRCSPAYKNRGLHDPDCDCDSADSVAVLRAILTPPNRKTASVKGEDR